jgi:hypothetical protein
MQGDHTDQVYMNQAESQLLIVFLSIESAVLAIHSLFFYLTSQDYLPTNIHRNI